MRLLTLLSPALLAATAFAAEAETTDASSVVESSSSSSAEGAQSTEEPTPVGEIWAPKWKAADLTSYNKKCVSKVTLEAELYKLSEMYPSLKDFAPELKVFYHKQLYPGSWNGEDRHGTDRELLKMDYEQLPFAVREWMKNNPKQRHFSVQEEIVFFAPGAIYPILPLWVDEPESDTGSISNECEGIFDDLENYSTEPKDGFVIGSVEYKKKEKQEIVFTIEAFQVKQRETPRDEL